jgi:hypothetical protein
MHEDRPGSPAKFLILGSASPSLIRDSSESLAGRIAYHELDGFDLGECGDASRDALWLRGGLPRAFLAAGGQATTRWREELVRTYLERDIPALGLRLPAVTLRRFWSMLAHFSGQTWNGSELARAFGVTERTVPRYLDILAGTFVVRILRPWHENLANENAASCDQPTPEQRSAAADGEYGHARGQPGGPARLKLPDARPLSDRTQAASPYAAARASGRARAAGLRRTEYRRNERAPPETLP